MSSYDKVIWEGKVVVGTKQTRKAVEQGSVKEVFVAKDADPRLINHMIDLCKMHGVKVTYVDSMKQLGERCGIDIGAAMAATMNE